MRKSFPTFEKEDSKLAIPTCFIGISATWTHCIWLMFTEWVENLFSNTASMICGLLSMAGQKNWLILSSHLNFIFSMKISRENYAKGPEILLLTCCLHAVCLSWSFVLTRCCILTWVTKTLMRAILNVHAGHFGPWAAGFPLLICCLYGVSCSFISHADED